MCFKDYENAEVPSDLYSELTAFFLRSTPFHKEVKNMLFTTLVAVIALCLLIPFTRMYGVIGTVITLYFYPYYTLTLLGAIALGVVTFLYLKHRRKSHA